MPKNFGYVRNAEQIWDICRIKFHADVIFEQWTFWETEFSRFYHFTKRLSPWQAQQVPAQSCGPEWLYIFDFLPAHLIGTNEQLLLAWLSWIKKTFFPYLGNGRIDRREVCSAWYDNWFSVARYDLSQAQSSTAGRLGNGKVERNIADTSDERENWDDLNKQFKQSAFLRFHLERLSYL